MTDIVEKPKPYQIADSLLEMAQDVEIGHADRLGVPAASFLRESADCISRQNDEIERLRGVEQDAAEWLEERTKRMRADNARLRAALREIVDREADASGGARLSDFHDIRCACGRCAADIARAALEGKDD